MTQLKPLNFNDVKLEVEDYQRKQLHNLTVINKVKEVLKPLDGKPMTKRIANAVQTAMPEYSVSWNTQFGMYHLDVEDISGFADNKLHILLGHQPWGSKSCDFSYDKFIENNQCYFLDQQRHEKLEQHKPNLEKYVQDYNAAIALLNGIDKAVSYDSYPLSSLFRVEQYDKSK